MHSRMLRHRVVTGAVTLTLALGGVAMTGSAANAADAGERVTAACTQAKKDLSAAKKKLRAAKRTDNASKIRKAQKKVKAAKARKESACAAPTQDSVLQQVQQGQLALSGVDTATLAQMLPPELAGAVGQVLAKLSGSLDAIGAQVPGADAAQLEQLSAAVTAMDAEGVVKALQTLAGTLLAGGASPAAINTLVQMLGAPLPGGGTVEIGGIPELQNMLGQLSASLPLLAGVDLTDPAAAAGAMGALKDGLAAITANVKGPSAGWLAALGTMVDQLGEIGYLVPGAAGSGALLTSLLNTMLSLAQPGTDPLVQLNQILASGNLAGILELLGIPVGGLLG